MAIRDKKEPLYMISVVARMLGVHPQTLRMYEKEGFVTPRRIKRLRLYSEDDVDKLHLILNLTKEMGVNKAGVEIILRMRHKIEALQKEMENIMQMMDEEMRHHFEEKIKNVFYEEEE